MVWQSLDLVHLWVRVPPESLSQVPLRGAPQVPGTWDAWDGEPDALLQKIM